MAPTSSQRMVRPVRQVSRVQAWFPGTVAWHGWAPPGKSRSVCQLMVRRGLATQWRGLRARYGRSWYGKAWCPWLVLARWHLARLGMGLAALER